MIARFRSEVTGVIVEVDETVAVTLGSEYHQIGGADPGPAPEPEGDPEAAPEKAPARGRGRRSKVTAGETW